MTRIQELYLSLLRKALWGEEMSAIQGKTSDGKLEPSDWTQVVELAMRQGTGPLIMDQLLALPKELADIPSELAMQMKQICMQNMLAQQQWEPIIAKAFQALEAQNIHPVLLKGFSLAKLYPKPYLRSWGDADIWVGVDNYHPACGILRQTFPQAIHHDEEWEELKHYCFVFPDGKAIELHRVAMDFISKRDTKYWQAIEREGLGGLQVNESTSQQVNELFNILFVFLHAWEHFTSSGMPMKQVCDLALCVKSLQVNKSTSLQVNKSTSQQVNEYLEPKLRRLKLMEVWQMVGYVATKTLGIPEAEWPLLTHNAPCTMQGEKLMERILQEGQCREKIYTDGSKDKYEARNKAKKMNILVRKLTTLRSRLDSYLFLKEYAPRYARHILWAELQKGIRRTLTGAKMIDY